MFKDTITIGSKKISKKNPSFIVAEAGVNHNGDLKLAYKLIDEARRIGADAIKFQSFTAERLVSKGTPKVAYQKNTSDATESHYDMIRKLEISEDFQKKLFDYCSEKGILFLSTPYDLESARFLHKLGVTAFKTASADIVDLPLHSFLASTKKPVFIAVGMATEGEIKAVLDIYKKKKNGNVVLLHCVSNYPASHESLNIRVIPALEKRFKTLVGFSDHSVGHVAAIAARTLGAVMTEKHFTLDKSMEGPDHKASDTPEQFASLVDAIRTTEKVLGSDKKRLQPEETSMREVSRKSLVATTDIPSGTKIKESMLTLKRPGTGIPYSQIKSVIGRTAKSEIAKDTLISKNILR